MKILALDLSLTATGYAGGAAVRPGVLTPPKDAARGPARLAWIRDSVLVLAAHGDSADLVCMEGYSFGQARGSSQMHSTGELGGVVRLALWEHRIPYVEIAPGTLKRYATGRGNAPKDEVLVAAVRRLRYDGSDHNVADAMWLLAMALDHYGAPPVQMPAAHRQALAAVQWPEIHAHPNGRQ